jgi:signal transduction histidine kinase
MEISFDPQKDGYIAQQGASNAPIVLIVDDSEMTRTTLQQLLMREPYTLAIAKNGREALSLVMELLPDLVLLDVMMPDVDGYEVCRLVRANPATADIPVIMLTALDDQESRQKGFKVGVDDFVTKPFDLIELRARVRSITRLNRQRRMRMAELQAEINRTQAILQSLGDSVFLVNSEQIVKYMNPAAQKLFGLFGDELNASTWDALGIQFLNGDTFEQAIQVARRKGIWRGEVTFVEDSDGVLECTLLPFFEALPVDVPVGYVGVIRDLTPFRESVRLQQQFIANVSHELRTPLSVIMLIIENYERYYHKMDDEARLRMIADIHKRADALNALAEKVLDISKMDSESTKKGHIPVNLCDIVKEETENQRPLIQSKKQDLELQAEKSQVVRGNETQLRRVVQNLLSNAIKYTPEGGRIEINCSTIEKLPPNVRKKVKTDTLVSSWVVFRVKDDGMGIRKEDQNFLFERFYRVTKEQNIPGTGLGLAIVAEFVKMHDGHITVESAAGFGSTFSVYLAKYEIPR